VNFTGSVKGRVFSVFTLFSSLFYLSTLTKYNLVDSQRYPRHHLIMSDLDTNLYDSPVAYYEVYQSSHSSLSFSPRACLGEEISQEEAAHGFETGTVSGIIVNIFNIEGDSE